MTFMERMEVDSEHRQALAQVRAMFSVAASITDRGEGWEN